MCARHFPEKDTDLWKHRGQMIDNYIVYSCVKLFVKISLGTHELVIAYETK